MPSQLVGASTATIKVRAGCDRKWTDSNMELTSIRADSTPFLSGVASDPSSLRSSLDNDYYQSQGCDIHIYDDIPLDPNTAPTSPTREFIAATWHGGVGNCDGLTQHLKVAHSRIRSSDTKLTFIRPGIRAGLDGCRHPRSHRYQGTKTQAAAATWWDGLATCWTWVIR